MIVFSQENRIISKRSRGPLNPPVGAKIKIKKLPSILTHDWKLTWDKNENKG